MDPDASGQSGNHTNDIGVREIITGSFVLSYFAKKA